MCYYLADSDLAEAGLEPNESCVYPRNIEDCYREQKLVWAYSSLSEVGSRLDDVGRDTQEASCSDIEWELDKVSGMMSHLG